MQRLIRRQLGPMRRHCFRAQFQNVGFQRLFHGVRKFHSGMRKKLHAVIVIGIVRSGNHHAGLKVVFSHQARHTRCGDHSGKFRACSSRLQSRGQQLRDVRPGLARVHPDQDMR